jgi:hypothetical protein
LENVQDFSLSRRGEGRGEGAVREGNRLGNTHRARKDRDPHPTLSQWERGLSGSNPKMVCGRKKWFAG